MEKAHSTKPVDDRKLYQKRYYEANKENIIAETNKAKKLRLDKSKEALKQALFNQDEHVLKKIILCEKFYEKHWSILLDLYSNVIH